MFENLKTVWVIGNLNFEIVWDLNLGIWNFWIQ